MSEENKSYLPEFEDVNFDKLSIDIKGCDDQYTSFNIKEEDSKNEVEIIYSKPMLYKILLWAHKNRSEIDF